ncbi:MAG: CCA tRNA nucleotidyltransferase [Acidimicrobiia bacterium]|nr:MAG: CCA tRNA nucleotidyltransferase [Acidimicrobiia bacterium]
MIPARLEWLVADDAPSTRLARAFGDAGSSLYLVGGSVRDALLERDSPDLDFTTPARPEQVKEIAEAFGGTVFTVGEAFGTIGLIVDGETFEITTFRKEIYRDDSRKPHVEYSDDIATDLSRRDFAVNAMALDILAKELIDPFGGLTDLAAGMLRTPIGPEVSFSDDPLRMLRMYRFVSTLGFAPSEPAEVAVKEMAARLEIVSAERIRDELDKLLVGDHVGDALWGLVESGLAEHFLPEFAKLADAVDPYHRHKDVLSHTIAVVEKTSPTVRLRLAALLHDIGKPETREFGPNGVSFHHHEVVGARMARHRMRELRYPRETVRDVGDLVFLHLRPHTFAMGWTDSAVRRYVRDAGHLLDDLNELVRCDVTTKNANRAEAIQRRIDELEERIDVLREQEELAALRPPVDGTQVMAYLGLTPGPQVGEVMRMLLEHRIEVGPYSEDEAYQLVRTWADEAGVGVPDPDARPPAKEKE